LLLITGIGGKLLLLDDTGTGGTGGTLLLDDTGTGITGVSGLSEMLIGLVL